MNVMKVSSDRLLSIAAIEQYSIKYRTTNHVGIPDFSEDRFVAQGNFAPNRAVEKKILIPISNNNRREASSGLTLTRCLLTHLVNVFFWIASRSSGIENKNQKLDEFFEYFGASLDMSTSTSSRTVRVIVKHTYRKKTVTSKG